MNIGLIKLKHQFVGIIPVLRITLNNFVNNSLNIGGLCFINSFIIVSMPLDLLFFSLFLRSFISMSVN